ncbi:E3 ubiquitin-protein ligase RNF4 isoform X2 [Salarias fasciatus]|uniref:RING-type domain-containing protein n=1 Tax=Salarias fasciatus TaxID=181472 RepID=A0A672GEL1_SALFA|nr:E3 ubiquitin-protein ligase RNF4 isoform X2 [Salarias fasciatus]
MNTSAQRKRRARPAVLPRPAPKTRRTTARAGSRRGGRIARRRSPIEEDPSNTAETIDVMDSTEDGEEEVVDLTCESAETSVVDLTSSDSVLVVEEGPQSRRGPPAHSYVVSSDEEEDTPPVLTATTDTHAHTSTRRPDTISCPICLDVHSEILESGRLIVSTQCGHVFCSQCLRDSLKAAHTCPTCRKRLTHRQYHPLYI